MFDIGWQELFIVGVLAIIVIGPKDLPGAMRTIAGLVRKARSMAREFQSSLDDMVREAELDDVKKQLDSAASYDIGREIENAIDPTGDIVDDLDMSGIESSLDHGLQETPHTDSEDPGDATALEDPSVAAGETPQEDAAAAETPQEDAAAGETPQEDAAAAETPQEDDDAAAETPQEDDDAAAAAEPAEAAAAAAKEARG